MIFPNRYSRQTNLKGFGVEAQQKLQQAKVLVVGAGGLGVPALQYLAGMGVGTIGIMDGDTVSASNLNRQILYYESEVGLPKVEVAFKKLHQQNPSITINSFNAFLNVDNAISTISNYDLVIDATDSFAARYLINDACVILKKPFIYGAIQQYEGHVSVFNYEGGPTYRCLYPDFPAANEIPDCNTAGVLGVVPGLIGCQQALEAVKVITRIGEIASGCLRIFDFLNNDHYEMKLKATPENLLISKLKESYEEAVCSSVRVIKPGELYGWLTAEKEFLLLDVREEVEYKRGHLVSSQLKPLSHFNVKNVDLKNDVPVVTFCEKGGRSLKAASLLLEKNNSLEVYSLSGGMEEWLKEIGNKLVVV